MDRRPLGNILRNMVGGDSGAEQSDAQLLERFAAQQDESAFAALLKRHAPMVLGVCRRVLRDDQEAEDACQVTFLVLARKAGTVRKLGSAASWLYGVALRVAGKVRRSGQRRQAREARVAEVAPATSNPETMWRDLQLLLDEELRRMPECFRAPLVLCYLESLSQEEAAQQLGWSRSTLKGRLARGKEMLRHRLSKRGLSLPAGLFIAVLAPNVVRAAVPGRLHDGIVQAAGALAAGAPLRSLLSPQVSELLEGVLRAMLYTQLKVAAGLTLALVLLVGSVGLLNGEAPKVVPPAPRTEAPPDQAPPAPSSVPAATLLTHDANARTLAYHPNGKMLATGGDGGQVWLWDLDTRKATVLPEKHQYSVRSVAFSLDGSLLASVDADNHSPPRRPSEVHIWDMEKRELRQKITAEGSGRHLAFAPDGKQIAFVDGKDEVVSIWNIGGDKEKTRFSCQTDARWVPLSLRYSPDGRMIAVAGTRAVPAAPARMRGEIKLFDLTGRQDVRIIDCNIVEVYGLAFSPDGRFLATTGWEFDPQGKKTSGPIDLWEVATLRHIARHEGHTTASWGIAFAPDGLTIASGANDGTARLWRVTGSKEVAILQTPKQLWGCLAFSPDGHTLAAAGETKNVQLWPVPPAAAPPVAVLSAERVKETWEALGNADPAAAYPVVAQLAASPVEAVKLLRQLRPTPVADADRVRGLIADQESAKFSTREQAARELSLLDEQVRGAIEAALAAKPSLDLQKRLEQLLVRLENQPQEETLRSLRAVTVLQIIGNAEARKLLEEWSTGNPEGRLTTAARAALKCLDANRPVKRD